MTLASWHLSFRPRSYVSRYFLIPNFFFADSTPSTRIRWIQHKNPQLFESALQSGNFLIRYEPGIVWTLNPEFFLSHDVTTSSSVLYRKYSRWLQSAMLRLFTLGWSGSGSVIQDHWDRGRSNEAMNPCPERIHWFIWSTMIRVISDHWSWSGSCQRSAAPLDMLFM